MSHIESEDKIKPFIINEEGLKLLKSISYRQTGSINSGAFRIILSFKGKDVVELNKNRKGYLFKILI